MSIKVSKPILIFVDNMIVMLNTNNPGISLNKKPVALSYHFVREHFSNNIVEVIKIHTSRKQIRAIHQTPVEK